MQPNEASYTIGPDDFVAAQQLHFRKRLTRRPVRNLLLLAIVLAGFSIFFAGSVSVRGLGLALALVVFAAILIWLMIPINARRSYAQRKVWDPVHVGWDASGVTISSSHGGGRFTWSEFWNWEADEKSVLLYLDARLFYMLPVRALPTGAAADIIAALGSAGIRQR